MTRETRQTRENKGKMRTWLGVGLSPLGKDAAELQTMLLRLSHLVI
jgi:hypothetical protein